MPEGVNAKSVHSIYDEEPMFNLQYLKFLEWISQYYYCDIQTLLSLAIPKKFLTKKEKAALIYNGINHQEDYTVVKSIQKGIQQVVDELINHEEFDTEAKQKGINKTVSIIMPCYNCGTLIDETMQSLQNQTYQNFEVICVNDGSTDNTLSVLEKWQQKGMNIKIINQTNGGVSVARNRGIKEVIGKYVLFLDSDDYLKSDSLLKLYNIANKKINY